VKPASNSKL
jgi:hypothetical protein